MTGSGYMRVLHADDYETKPWKNGQGVTRDILLLPETEDFDIRVSLADIPPESTFSAFPGITRHITLLVGAATLEFADGTVEHLRPMAPLTFDSKQTPFCRASGGTVRVLNVMTRTAQWRSSVVALAGGGHKVQIPRWGALLLFAVTGQWSVQAGPSAADCAEGETLLAGGYDAAGLASPPDSKALLATLTPCDGAGGHFFGFSKSNSRN